MFFVIHCLDHDDSLEKRLKHLDAHKSYVATAPIKTIISGPLLGGEEGTMIGSLFIVEAESMEAVAAFNSGDPLNRAGLWKSVNIHAFSKRIDNR